MVFAAATRIGAGAATALAFGTAAGVLFNFVTYGAYAFRDLTLARSPRFVLAYAAVYTLNLALLTAMAALQIDRIGAQAILTVPLAILSYILMKRFVFVGSTDAQHGE
jgi:putative flippase GtrA